jgi:hypothetical protein
MSEHVSTKQKAASPSTALASGGLLQRKCACGSHTTASDECADCAKKSLQRQVSIGASNDPMEHEADRIADQVMAAPVRPIGGSVPLGIQRVSSQSHGGAEKAPDSVERALASTGAPLEASLQQEMGQRLGHDFSQVRVHSGAAAAQSARDVNAHAYTVGNHVVFGAGRLAPSTNAGRRLLAHELTHVVQQSGHVLAPASGQLGARTLQRSCGEKQIGETEVDAAGVQKELGDPGVKGVPIRFKVGCDEFLSPQDEAALRGLAQTLPWRTRIAIHGFASEEGPTGFNQMLSLSRAVKARSVLSNARPAASIERVVWHGSVPGKRADRRAVVIQTLGAPAQMTKSLTIVSWINGRDLPSFSRFALAMAPKDHVADFGACMALKCTANTPPPTTLGPSDLSAFIATKQYRAVQSYVITYGGSSGARGEILTRQIAGYTAPSSCGPIPPKTFRQGEISPLNSVSTGLTEAGASVDALMKLRVSTEEESDAIDAATSFPASMLISRDKIRHVPWVWSQTRLRLNARTGLLQWAVRSSNFPTNTIYLNGVRVAETEQGPCRILFESRFRSANAPRQSMAEEAKQATVPINKQEETVEEGPGASGQG